MCSHSHLVSYSIDTFLFSIVYMNTGRWRANKNKKWTVRDKEKEEWKQVYVKEANERVRVRVCVWDEKRVCYKLWIYHYTTQRNVEHASKSSATVKGRKNQTRKSKFVAIRYSSSSSKFTMVNWQWFSFGRIDFCMLQQRCEVYYLCVCFSSLA